MIPARTPQKSVLIVDESEETREVLRTVLARKGHQIWEAREIRQGLQLAQLHHPDVIVLDVDMELAVSDSAEGGFDAPSPAGRPALVVIGRARCYPSLPADRVLSKPYQYGSLIGKIEELLQSAAEKPL